MKIRTLLIAFTLLISFAGLAEVVTISGTVINPKKKKIEIITDEYFIADYEERKAVKIKGNKFSQKLEISKAQWIKLKYNNKVLEIYVEPNDNIKLNIPENNIKKAKFTGKGAGNNNFWRKYQRIALKDKDGINLKDRMKSSSIDSWEIYLFKKLRSFKTFFKENESSFNISYSFEKYLKDSWENYYLANLISYPIEMANISAKKQVNRLPKVMLEVLKEERINKPQSIIDPEYRKFVEYFVRYKAVELNEFQKFEDRSDWLRKQLTAAENHLTDQPLQYVLANTLMKNGIDAKPGTANLLYKTMSMVDENDYAKLMDERKDDWLAKPDSGSLVKKTEEDILAEIEKDREELKANDGSFRMLDMEGNKVGLGDLIGKVVYVDIWASWCGPCIKQMPHGKKLKEKFTKEQLEQIEFVYINIDNTVSKWKGAVNKHDIHGTHLHSPGGWGSEVTKIFSVRSIPRFMLFDKAGVLIEENAKRPSDATLFDDLVKLINEKAPKIDPEKIIEEENKKKEKN